MGDETEIIVADGELKRDIGLFSLITIILGVNVAASAFIIPAIAAGMTGPSVFIAQMISVIPILLALIPYVVLSTSIPTTCASYQYAKFFSPLLALSGVLVIIVGMTVGGVPLYAIAAGEFLQGVIPLVTQSMIVPLAFVTLTILYILNLLGIKPVGYVQVATVVTLFIALLIFGIGGIPSIDTGNFANLFTGGATGLLGGAAVLFTLCAGGLFGIDVGEEVKNPKKTIPKALIIAMTVVITVYILTQITALGVISPEALAAEGTLLASAKAFLPTSLLGFFAIGGGFLACVTTINVVIAFAGRYFMTVAKDGFFPSFLGEVNDRFGTPHWGITFFYVFAAIIVLINPPLETLANFLNFGLIFMITLVLLYAYKFPEKHPEVYENATIQPSPKLLKAVSIVAIAINVLFMILLATSLHWAFIFFVIAALLAIPLYYQNKK